MAPLTAPPVSDVPVRERKRDRLRKWVLQPFGTDKPTTTPSPTKDKKKKKKKDVRLSYHYIQ